MMNGFICEKQRELEIRHSRAEDLPYIMALIRMASAYMKCRGIDQWQNGYPNEEQILKDIALQESYVCLVNGRIIGTSVLSLRHEPTYDSIYDGQWRTDGAYGVIHRIAVDDTYKGHRIAGRFVDYIERLCKNAGIAAVRVDTHRDNISMQHMLMRCGFVYCGVIYLADGAPRVAYEKILP